MAFYIIGANGRKTQELYELHELQELADEGTITSATLLESDSGHRGKAGEHPGLRFNTVKPRTPTPPVPPDPDDDDEVSAGSFFKWLFDFAFEDIRIHTAALWFCRIGYILLWIGAILVGLWVTYLTFRASEVFGPLILIAVPFQWFFVLLYMIMTRLYFEGFLIVFDWIVETTKAARIYIENSRRK